MGRQFNESHFNNLRMPTDKEFNKIRRELRLSSEQLQELKRSMDKAFAECIKIKERLLRPDRDVLIGKAETVAALLDQLEREICRDPKVIDAITTPENLGAIGRLLSFEAVREATESKLFDRPARPELDKLERREVRLTSILEFEWEMADIKQIVDANQRSDLLLHIVRTMRMQFTNWLDQKVADTGGPAANPVLRIMLFALACDASRILGDDRNKPAISRTGGVRFRALCNAVFNRCGIDTDTLEPAVKNFLKKEEVWVTVAHFNGLPLQSRP